MNNWEMPELLKNVDVEVLKLALSQADLRQKDLETTSANITGRVQTLLTVFIGTVVASIGFFLSHTADGLPFIAPSLATSLYSLLVCRYLLLHAYTGSYIPVGGVPSILLQVKLIEAGTDKDKLHNLYLSLLGGADKRIKTNRSENSRRWVVLEKATTAAIWMPVILCTIYLVALYLNWN